MGKQPSIAVPPGWFELVYEMCAQIEDIAQLRSQKYRQRLFLPRLISIELESGKLSCEVINRNKDISDIIWRARMRSARICMICGDEAHQFRFDGSLVSHCKTHRADTGY